MINDYKRVQYTVDHSRFAGFFKRQTIQFCARATCDPTNVLRYTLFMGIQRVSTKFGNPYGTRTMTMAIILVEWAINATQLIINIKRIAGLPKLSGRTSEIRVIRRTQYYYYYTLSSAAVYEKGRHRGLRTHCACDRDTYTTALRPRGVVSEFNTPRSCFARGWLRANSINHL